MALTETKVLAEVAILPNANAINVRWDNIIERDGEVISRVPHRKSYGQMHKSEFMAEVEDAQKYITAMGW